VSTQSRSPKNFRGRVKGIPPFLFTPYSVSTTTRKDFAVRRRTAGTPCRRIWFQTGWVGKVGSTCTPQVLSQWYREQFTIWDTVTTYKDYGQIPYILNEWNQSDISNAFAEVEDQVIQDALTSYDALTDIAQLSDIPKLLGSVTNDIKSIIGLLHGRYGKSNMKHFADIDPLDLLKDTSRIARKFGEEWMQYRYAIMPLVYSYRDIQKALKRHSQVRERATTNITPRDLNISLPPSGSTYVVQEYNGCITIRGCVFEDFLLDEVSKVSGIGFNPLVTLWELIPYSFVVDWFVNVGDYIARKTSMSFAQRAWACTSRRDNYSYTTSVHLPTATQSVTVQNNTPVGWVGAQPPANAPLVITNPEGRYPLRMEITDAYYRSPFELRGARLRINPSLNWRRLLDTGVMSINQLRGFMNHIRR